MDNEVENFSGSDTPDSKAWESDSPNPTHAAQKRRAWGFWPFPLPIAKIAPPNFKSWTHPLSQYMQPLNCWFNWFTDGYSPNLK
jgi:hypothetical protein